MVLSGGKRPLSGGSLLDDILSKTTKLHSSVKVSRGGDDALETASPYMLARAQQPAAGAAAGPSTKCRNPTCQSELFDIDWRHGDRVCQRCGVIQNSRSMESQEEEHRTFADDENKESKKRSEVNDGTQGGRTGDASLRTAAGLANLGGSAGMDKEAKKLKAFQEKVKDICRDMELPHSIRETAMNLLTNYTTSTVKHDDKCQNPNCRLRRRPKKESLVAASVCKMALKQNGLDRQFQEFAKVVRDQSDGETLVSDVSKAHGVVSELVKAFDIGCRYTCVDADGVVGIVNEEEPTETFLSAVTALLPRLVKDAKLPFMVQSRAEEIYKEWARLGTSAAMPQTTAAAAVQAAAEDTTEQMQKHGLPHPKVVKSHIIAGLSEAAGVGAATILKVLNENQKQLAASKAAGASSSKLEVKVEQ